jgi:hypothetical protein
MVALPLKREVRSRTDSLARASRACNLGRLVMPTSFLHSLRASPLQGPAAFLIIGALSAWSGCGGKSADGSRSGGAPGYTFGTSVDGGVPLNGLTPSQATQLCSDINAASGSLQKTYCDAVNQGFAVNGAYLYLQGNPGASTATLRAKCASYLQGEQSSGCTAPSATCDVSTIRNNSATCAATVSDEVTCINENATIDQAFLNATPACTSLSASVLGRYFAEGGAFDTYNVVANSASCAALANCVGISP